MRRRASGCTCTGLYVEPNITVKLQRFPPQEPSLQLGDAQPYTSVDESQPDARALPVRLGHHDPRAADRVLVVGSYAVPPGDDLGHDDRRRDLADDAGGAGAAVAPAPGP